MEQRHQHVQIMAAKHVLLVTKIEKIIKKNKETTSMAIS